MRQNSTLKSDPNVRVQLTVDLDKPGLQTGDIMLRWSDNLCPLGYHSSPVIKLGHNSHPSILMIGGVHGDEFEGPAALMQLARSLRQEELSGRIIILPACNRPAISASSRVSPLDGENLNRAFPGNPSGGPTAMLAHFLETSLIPMCDAVIDLHSGGKASVFQPCTLVTQTESTELFQRNLDLAYAFGLPLIWLLGDFNDARSMNTAAARNAIPMIAAELGGGGGVDPTIVEQATTGLKRCLAKLGILEQRQKHAQMNNPLAVEINDARQNLYSSGRGLFQRKFQAGEFVEEKQCAGILHYLDEPERPSAEILFPKAGFVLAHTNRGMVTRGDLLALVASVAAL
ncbi:MAG: succinylglutamate desuccinylase/aspartoacylase family protein [Albidovulum sp.]|nr:succinylglutamate desuccinylase/aspartoacylase family protein [Albidovulum sp.]